MSPFLRKVPTGSGATAVQIADKTGGQYRIVEHLGSAHTDEELAALMAVGRERLHPDQGVLDFDAVDRPATTPAVITSSRCGILIDAVRGVYDRLGFNAVDDEALFQLVAARLVEPTAKTDSIRVLGELGMDAVSLSSLKRSLVRSIDKDYRAATRCEVLCPKRCHDGRLVDHVRRHHAVMPTSA